MDFKDYMKKDNSMSAAKMDELINEIKGLRSDIKTLMESTQYSAPVVQENVAAPAAQPQVAPATESLFGMPMQSRQPAKPVPHAGGVKAHNSSPDIKSILDHAGQILA